MGNRRRSGKRGRGKRKYMQVVQNAMPSIVAITGVSVQEIPDFWGYGSRQYESESSGSGIVIAQTDTQLLIATNDHVVENQNTLSVVFTNQDGSAAQEGWSDGAVPARVRGTSPENDLSVISVDLADIPESIRPNIRVAAIGDSDALQVGNTRSRVRKCPGLRAVSHQRLCERAERVFPFLKAVNEILTDRGVSLPLPPQAQTTMETRLAAGEQAMVDIVGESCGDLPSPALRKAVISTNGWRTTVSEIITPEAVWATG